MEKEQAIASFLKVYEISKLENDEIKTETETTNATSEKVENTTNTETEKVENTILENAKKLIKAETETKQNDRSAEINELNETIKNLTNIITANKNVNVSTANTTVDNVKDYADELLKNN